MCAAEEASIGVFSQIPRLPGEEEAALRYLVKLVREFLLFSKLLDKTPQGDFLHEIKSMALDILCFPTRCLTA